MSFIRHGFLNHIFDSTPSFASMHLPELGKTVSAAITTPAGTFAYSPDANIERLDVEALNSTASNAQAFERKFQDMWDRPNNILVQ